MSALGLTLYWVLSLAILVLLARAVIGYIPMFKPGWRPTGAVAVFTDGVYRITDPVLRPLDRLIPPISIGSTRFSISFLLLFLLLAILRSAALTL